MSRPGRRSTRTMATDVATKAGREWQQQRRAGAELVNARKTRRTKVSIFKVRDTVCNTAFALAWVRGFDSKGNVLLTVDGHPETLKEKGFVPCHPDSIVHSSIEVTAPF